jgi:isopentenyl phosphate kinase
MKFYSTFSTQEQKLIYQRTLKEMERQLMEALLTEGIDPVTFEPSTFVVELDPNGLAIPNHTRIAGFISKIELLNEKIKSVTQA